jgi:hypothetical protein
MILYFHSNSSTNAQSYWIQISTHLLFSKQCYHYQNVCSSHLPQRPSVWIIRSLPLQKRHSIWLLPTQKNLIVYCNSITSNPNSIDRALKQPTTCLLFLTSLSPPSPLSGGLLLLFLLIIVVHKRLCFKSIIQAFHFLHMGPSPMSDVTMLWRLCVADFGHTMPSWHCCWPKVWQISARAKPKLRLFAASTSRKPLLEAFTKVSRCLTQLQMKLKM